MKDTKAFKAKRGVCYKDDEGDSYSYADLLNMVIAHLDYYGLGAYDPEIVTKNLFDALDWQHPSTILDEMERYHDYGTPYYNQENN